MSTLGKESAFPEIHTSESYSSDGSVYGDTYSVGGMNIRTWLAGLAMQGLLADHKDHSDECADGETCSQTVARLAVQHADDLLARLEKHK